MAKPISEELKTNPDDPQELEKKVISAKLKIEEAHIMTSAETQMKQAAVKS